MSERAEQEKVSVGEKEATKFCLENNSRNQKNPFSMRVAWCGTVGQCVVLTESWRERKNQNRVRAQLVGKG